MADWVLLAVLAGLAAAASLISVRVGISVAIIEIILGIALGNLFGVTDAGADWLPFLASIGSVILTFLAGSEIDGASLRRNWRPSVGIGTLSFLAPFAAATAVARFLLDWSPAASLICGAALSTTSVAVVYVVLVETGRTQTEVGKLLLAACFITDLGTALALSILFVRPNPLIVVLFVAIIVAALLLPRLSRWIFPLVRGSSSEPELRLTMFVVLLLAMLAIAAGSFAVLPAYVLGLSMAATFEGHREVLTRFRTVAFAFLTPFFFLYAGLNVSLVAVASGMLLVLLFFGVKVGAKFAGVWPLSRHYVGGHATYVTLLMSTGLTFGTIASLYGLAAGLINGSQFSVLLAVVLSTAIVPTFVAERWFSPPAPG
jgi:Kef-type K+ transport system membrane component KefB